MVALGLMLFAALATWVLWPLVGEPSAEKAVKSKKQ